MKKFIFLISFIFLASIFQIVKADASHAMPAIISYLLSGNTPTVSKLLKTGQTKCYDFDFHTEEYCAERHRGQDGYYQKGVDRSYTTSLPHLTVKDLTTGLTWQDHSSLFAGVWGMAGNHCANLNFDNSIDWRLPSIDELQTLVDYGKYKGDAQNSLAAINPIFLYGFTASGSYPYNEFWSFTELSGLNSQQAWWIGFGHGADGVHPKYNIKIARCVRGSFFVPLAKHSVSSTNGIAIDNDTGLMWQDNDDIGTINETWKNAVEYCEDLTLGDYEDWRLPNITELLSITDKNSNINPSFKNGFSKVSSHVFWSSTTVAYSSNRNSAWSVNFYYGNDVWRNKYNHHLVRCVR